MSKPLVLLDVDGVINVFDSRRPCKEETFKGYWISVPTEIIPGLIELTSVADVMWLTTWRNDANLIGQWLGMPVLPAFDDGSGERRVDWKWETAKPFVERVLEQGRKVVWIEDFGSDPQKTMAERAGVKTVDTWSAGGLSKNSLDAILDWCKNASSS